MKPSETFCSSQSLSTTNSALDIEWRGPNVSISPWCQGTTWFFPGHFRGSWFVKLLFNSSGTLCYCLRIISSKSDLVKFFTSITWLISNSEDLKGVNFPCFLVQKKNDSFNITIRLDTGCGGCSICHLNTTPSEEYAVARGSCVTPCTVIGASLQCVAQFWDSNVTVLRYIVVQHIWVVGRCFLGWLDSLLHVWQALPIDPDDPELWFRLWEYVESIQIQLVSHGCSVTNGSNPLEQFRVRVGTRTELLQWALPPENQDCCNWAGFTTKNPVFQHHDFASN